MAKYKVQRTNTYTVIIGCGMGLMRETVDEGVVRVNTTFQESHLLFYWVYPYSITVLDHCLPKNSCRAPSFSASCQAHNQVFFEDVSI